MPRTLSILEGESGSKLKNIEKPGISRRHLDIDVHRTLGVISAIKIKSGSLPAMRATKSSRLLIN